jgi:hypothetical protein
MHRQMTPDLATAAVSVGQSGSVVSLLLAMGGSGYVLERPPLDLVAGGGFMAVAMPRTAAPAGLCGDAHPAPDAAAAPQADPVVAAISGKGAVEDFFAISARTVVGGVPSERHLHPVPRRMGQADQVIGPEVPVRRPFGHQKRGAGGDAQHLRLARGGGFGGKGDVARDEADSSPAIHSR